MFKVSFLVYLGMKLIDLYWPLLTFTNERVYPDATSPALPRGFPSGAPVPDAVDHAARHNPPHGDPRGSAQHQPEPGSFHQGPNPGGCALKHGSELDRSLLFGISHELCLCCNAAAMCHSRSGASGLS